MNKDGTINLPETPERRGEREYNRLPVPPLPFRRCRVSERKGILCLSKNAIHHKLMMKDKYIFRHPRDVSLSFPLLQDIGI